MINVSWGSKCYRRCTWQLSTLNDGGCSSFIDDHIFNRSPNNKSLNTNFHFFLKKNHIDLILKIIKKTNVHKKYYLNRCDQLCDKFSAWQKNFSFFFFQQKFPLRTKIAKLNLMNSHRKEELLSNGFLRMT